jgi:hypothetical protein
MTKYKARVLNDKGFSVIEFSIGIVALIIILIVVVMVANHNGNSNAGSNNYEQLQTVTWNPDKTAYYANSNFNNYACVTQDTNTKELRVSGIMVADDYTGYIKSGSYEPGVSIRLNGSNSTIQSFGNDWAVGSIQNINGAFIKFSTGLLPVNTIYQASPLATNYWPSVWTDPVVIKNLSTCDGSSLVLPTQAVTTLTSAVSATSTTLNISSFQSFPLTVSFYIKVDNEIMLVTSGEGTNTWTVTRGVSGTTIASHANSEVVQEYIPPVN